MKLNFTKAKCQARWLIPIIVTTVLAGCGEGSPFTVTPVREDPPPKTITIVVPPPETPTYYIVDDPTCTPEMTTLNNKCKVTVERYCILENYFPEPCYAVNPERHCNWLVNRIRYSVDACAELAIEGV